MDDEWGFVASIEPAGGAGGAFGAFAGSISLSGRTAVVGARDFNGSTGAAYVFRLDGTWPDIPPSFEPVIFADGFESGDTSAWSSSVP